MSNAHHSEIPQDLISNATLSAFHASTTESILSWPQFSEFRDLIKDRGFSVFHLESTRPPLAQRPSAIQPYMTKSEVERMVRSFERNINFWYPTMNQATLRELRMQISSGVFEETTRSCLALLVMALGCAGELVSSFSEQETFNADHGETWNQKRLMRELYFDSAYKKIHLAQAEFTADAVQCLFFTG